MDLKLMIEVLQALMDDLGPDFTVIIQQNVDGTSVDIDDIVVSAGFIVLSGEPHKLAS